MGNISERSLVSGIRWVARSLGTLIGLVALLGIGEWLQDKLVYKHQATTPGYLVWVGFVLIFAGCVIGWFKDLAASLLILGGTMLLGAIALLVPSAFRGLHFLSIPALLGFLFLYVHLAGKKK
jgi:hypothetical protein